MKIAKENDIYKMEKVVKSRIYRYGKKLIT